MGSSKVRDMLPWVTVLAIYLFNPIGLTDIPPAVALLSFLMYCICPRVGRCMAACSSHMVIGTIQARDETDRRASSSQQPASAGNSSSQQPALAVSGSSSGV